VTSAMAAGISDPVWTLYEIKFSTLLDKQLVRRVKRRIPPKSLYPLRNLNRVH